MLIFVDKVQRDAILNSKGYYFRVNSEIFFKIFYSRVDSYLIFSRNHLYKDH